MASDAVLLYMTGYDVKIICFDLSRRRPPPNLPDRGRPQGGKRVHHRVKGPHILAVKGLIYRFKALRVTSESARWRSLQRWTCWRVTAKKVVRLRWRLKKVVSKVEEKFLFFGGGGLIQACARRHSQPSFMTTAFMTT